MRIYLKINDLGKLLLAVVLSFAVSQALPQCAPGQEVVTIEITTDDFGNETSWQLYQVNGGMVASGPIGPAYAGNTTYFENICVDTGSCYYFVMNDGFGDGMCCFYGDGYFIVYYGGDSIGGGGVFADMSAVYGIGNCTAVTPLYTNHNTYTPPQLVNDVFLGSCVEAFNINYTGVPAAVGYFSNGSSMGMETGLILTTGNTDIGPGPNNTGSAGYETFSPGNPILSAVTGVTADSNAASLEFDFISFNDTVTFRYIFASEEYNEFVCSQYNDVFAFLVTGPGYAPNTNIAVLPGTSIPVAINTVNNGSPGDFPGVPYNCALVTTPPADLSNTAYYVDNAGGLVTQFDGYTVPITATMVVVPCDTYHIQMVIADVGDGLWDSGVLLEAESFTAGESVGIHAASSDGTKNAYEGCNDGSFTFFREDSSNVANPVTISFILSGTAADSVDYTVASYSVVIPANQYSASVSIITALDGIAELPESVILSYQDVCNCNVFKRDTIFIFDNAVLGAGAAGPSLICQGQQATLTATGNGSSSIPYSYSWSTGDSTRQITVSPDTTSSYTVTVSDGCAGQTAAATFQLNVAPEVIASFTTGTPQCLPGNSFDFINASVYTGIPTFFWNLGDATTDNTEDVLDHSYAAAGSYDVFLRVTVNGCTDSIAQVVEVFAPVSSNMAAAICPDSSIFAGGAERNTPGIYFDTLVAANGCDSIIITDLTVLPYLYMNQLVVICEGDSFFAGGEYRYSSGVYFDTVPSGMGCDMVVMTEMTVLNDVFFYRDVSICENDSFLAGGAWQDLPGTYYDTLIAANACDSIVITDLAVLLNSAGTANRSICEGDSIYAGGGYQKASGSYLDTLLSANGCDSILTTNLTVLDTSVLSVNVSICDGDTYFAGGAFQSAAGVYYDTFSNANNCDSIVITNLSIRNNSAETRMASICAGDSFLAGGAYQYASGSYIDVLVSANGCDSILTTNLTVLDTSVRSVNVSICDGDTYFAGGAFQSAAGVYYDTFSNANNCDSIVITNLSIRNNSAETRMASICEGDSFLAGGAYQYASGSYIDVLVSANGCDSILTTNLTVLDTSVRSVNVSICDGDTYFAGGAFQSTAGFYYDTFSNANNCDSIVITNLSIRNNSAEARMASICEGDSFLAGGAYQYASGSYIDVLVSANGCDSILTTNLTVLDTSIRSVNISICAGDTHFAGGAFQSAAGVYYDTFPNANSCDSVIITNLSIRNNSAETRMASICEGDSFLAGGVYQYASGSYADTLLSANGCDSILTTILAVFDTSTTYLAVSICDGDSFFAGNSWRFASGTYYDTLNSLHGCDSIIVTNLSIAFVTVDAGIGAGICPGGSAQLNATGALTYSWSPANGLDDPALANPNASPSATTTYTVTGYGAWGGNLIVNGDFNSGNTGFTSAYAYSPGLNTAEGQYAVGSNSQAWNGNMAGCSDHTSGTGDYMMVNGNTDAIAQVWCQTVNVSPGTEYAFSTWIATLHNSNPAQLQFSINGTLIGQIIAAGPSVCVWQQFYATWNSGSNTTADICIVNQNTAFLGNDFGLDDISFAPMCSATDTVTVTVYPDYSNAVNASICDGESYTLPDGSIVNSAGTYPVSLSSVHGCDSLVATVLSVLPILSDTVSARMCAGDSVIAGGKFQTQPGIYYDTVTASSGCDSIVVTGLSVADTFRIFASETICEGDSAFAGGGWQRLAGTYYDNLSTTAGCDSIIVTDVSVIPTIYTQSDEVICDGDSFFVAGAFQKDAGIYRDTLAGSNGCDSVHITNLALNNSYATRDTIHICDGDSVFAGGSWRKLSGDYIDSLLTAAGCDSIIAAHVVVDTVIQTPVAASICFGETYFAGGGLQSTPGVYSDTYLSSTGCDSVVTTTLAVLDTFIRYASMSICEGDSIFVGGAWQKGGGVYVDTLFSSGGCDSTVEISLSVTQRVYARLDTVICEGDSVYAGGKFQISEGIYVDTIASSTGCDSIVTTGLSVIEIALEGDTVTVCLGEGTTLYSTGSFASYLWSPGGEASSSISATAGIYTLAVTDTNNCTASAVFWVDEADSILLKAVPEADTIIEGESAVLEVSHSSHAALISLVWNPPAWLDCPTCDRVIASPDDDITYTVIATDDFGCTDEVMIQIVVDTLLDPAVYIPNAFTPNGDGFNDEFNVYGQGIEGFRLRIYDRWGELIFETLDPGIGWDGTFKGNPCNPGVYIYYVEAGFIRNERLPDFARYRKGSVTLIR